jgi:hypothetical protein
LVLELEAAIEVELDADGGVRCPVKKTVRRALDGNGWS